jgi:hypothetical protein
MLCIHRAGDPRISASGCALLEIRCWERRASLQASPTNSKANRRKSGQRSAVRTRPAIPRRMCLSGNWQVSLNWAKKADTDERGPSATDFLFFRCQEQSFRPKLLALSIRVQENALLDLTSRVPVIHPTGSFRFFCAWERRSKAPISDRNTGPFFVSRSKRCVRAVLLRNSLREATS